MNKVVRSIVGVIFAVLTALSFLGLVLYTESWEASVVKSVAALLFGSLLGAVISFNWEDFKTLPRDLHEFFFVDDDSEEVVQQYVDTSDPHVPYQSPWTLVGTEEKKKLPPAKVQL